MNIYLMYIMITLISLIIIILIKDKQKALKILGKITIISSITIMILIVILSIILKDNINFINISIITNYLIKEYLKNNLIILIIGITELIFSKLISIVFFV